MLPASCLNCNADLAEDQKFCSACGQKSATHRLGLHEIVHDGVHYFTHADKSIFSLYKALLKTPGTVAREYIEGKRQKYFKPLNFFLIVAGLLVFVSSSFYKPDTNKRTQAMKGYAMQIKDPVKKQKMLDMAERSEKVSTITGKYSNIINMTATPIISFLFWLFYYRRRYNYIEHLVANMYFIAFIMTFYSLIILPLQHFIPGLALVWIGIFFLLEMIYRGKSYTGFIGDGFTKTAVKAYCISFFISIMWFGITGSLIMWYIKTGFQ